ncbi:ShlB/FhaC/HecB family hemolysin secretion/activation protein [Pantoea sp. Ap-967]|uniref:ShlB/FhaC/HecB family hemolysin secretion/activation protein n=1 Tax=Pantoea sp. Ap-967 TaxID=2608362 RepID=UPI00142418D6|nr:ShlB/FhaC/HecB family hemolysin secretion/activation protein [Pantoea sp. Ap-967]NIE74489.1 ShlB/FhaC/HecB family hemolysin secretion/activation protein [Pantoea sp. Ap-967]
MPFRLPPCARPLLAWLLPGLLGAPLALADDPASQQLRDQQQSLQQLEQRQRLQRWQREPAAPRREAAPAPITGDNACWRVSGLRLAGNQRLARQALEPAVQPLMQPCMGIDAINRLLRAITQHYVQAGYPTSRPYLRQAPRHGAPLDILIDEGFVEAIELDADLPLSLASAFPGQLGQPLYLPALEQGLDQLNRLRAFELSADLLPGEQQGATRVALQARQVAPRWHLDSQLDNRGSALTGRHRLTLGTGVDSPLGLNDDLRLSFNTLAFAARGSSQGLSLYYSLPYGPWTFALNASQQRYDAPTPSSQRRSSGSSQQQGASAERVLWRGPQGMLSATARLDRKQLVNRHGDQVIALQSPTLTTVEAGLNLLWLEQGLWHASLGIAQGTPWLGADRPADGNDAPRPDFRKYRASLLHLRQGPAQWPWRWQSELALQYSNTPLAAVEQFQLGSDTAVRGFRQRTYAGANAAVWRNTFSQALPGQWTAPFGVRPYIALDQGWSQLTRGAPSQRLSGVAAGVELTAPHSRLRLDYQRALHASDTPRAHLEPGFWVVEWSLNL